MMMDKDHRLFYNANVLSGYKSKWHLSFENYMVINEITPYVLNDAVWSIPWAEFVLLQNSYKLTSLWKMQGSRSKYSETIKKAINDTH